MYTCPWCVFCTLMFSIFVWTFVMILVGNFYMLLLDFGIYLILKMVTEALFINVSCVIDQRCSVPISHWLHKLAGKNPP
jgi:hypothetical protein